MVTKLSSLRELDAFVAEKVMGWTRVTFKNGPTWVRGVPKGSIPALPCDRWQPTTDANAMMEVVEKMRRDRTYVAFATHDDFERYGVLMKNDSVTTDLIFDRRPGVAVALAACAAVGHPVELEVSP